MPNTPTNKSSELDHLKLQLKIREAADRILDRALAMRHTSELQDVINTVGEQLRSLELDITGGVFISINEEVDQDLYVWGSGVTANYAERVRVPAYKRPIFTGMVNHIKSGSGLLLESFNKNQKIAFFKHLFKYPPYNETTKAHQKEVFAREGGYTRATYTSEHTSVCFINHHGRKFSDTDQEVLIRFAEVFERGYRRFLDLKRAEEQAREAQIEAALERVRAASMAMHKSEDLNQVIATVFDQLQTLGFETVQCEIVLFDTETNDCEVWPSNEMENVLPRSYRIPYSDRAFYQVLLNAWKTGTDYHPYELKGRTKSTYEKWLFTQTDWKHIPKAVQKSMQEIKRVYLYWATTKHGILEVGGIDRISDAQFGIIKRFAKVFEQSYTRFLDLQKAEAQAREAQIEAALERVRSRTMGMHHSGELREVVAVLYQQVARLGLADWGCNIQILNAREKEMEIFLSENENKTFDQSFYFRGEKHPGIKAQWDNWRNKKQRSTLFLKGRSKRSYDNYIFKHTDFIFLPEKMKAGIRSLSEVHFNFSRMRYGFLVAISVTSGFKEEEFEILDRFAKVFEQTYTRFLDLQKAEAQAREAQIEAALERVRSASSAMHHSSELAKVASVLFVQLHALGGKLLGAGFALCKKDDLIGEFWLGNSEAVLLPTFHFPHKKDPTHKRMYESWKAGEILYREDGKGKKLKRHYQNMMRESSFREEVDVARKEGFNFPDWQQWNAAHFKHGYLLLISTDPYPHANLLPRFAKVFEQTYTRFLDLQKAEAQAREAQIETSLEKVRAQSLAMHDTSQLQDVVNAVNDQLNILGLELDGTFICIREENKGKEVVGWVNTKLTQPRKASLPYYRGHLHTKLLHHIQNGKGLSVEDYDKEAVRKWRSFLFTQPGWKDRLKKANKALLESIQDYHRSTWASDLTTLSILRYSDRDFTSDEHHILERISKVFEQSYRRFLDLQKAEAQAHEAQVETALEKVRSRTMGMQKSEELQQVIQLVYDQFVQLDILVEHTGFIVDYKNREDMLIWLADPKGVPALVSIPYFDSPHWNRFLEAREKGESFFANHLSFEEKNKFYKTLFTHIPGIPQKAKKQYLSCPGLAISTVLLDNVGLYIENFSGIPYTEEENDTLLRFGNVFQQTYTRFLDLQKAEAQTREARIETALERVRAKAMAMHSSEDLASTVDTFFSELNTLNVMPRRCGVGIIHAETRLVDIHATTATEDNEVKKMTGNLTLTGHPVLENIYKHWIDQKEYHPVLKGNDISAYYKAMNPEVTFPDFADDIIQYGYYFFFKEGGVFAWTDKELAEPELEIFRRYNSVLSLTYRRYMDLIEAEAREREAIKESSLDRIRAEIASMRSKEDLRRITPLVWRELTTLEVPFFRCGVFIIDEEEKIVNVYLSTPDGHSLGVMHLSFDANPLTKNAVESWRKKEVYTAHWDKKAFTSWMQTMSEQGQIEDQQTYQGAASAPESLDLHFIPFKQGMLYVGNSEPLQKEKIELVDALAKAFAIAYARYEDFNKIEQAKLQVEKTLVDLKQAQSQLVQSEKMASLGELTAGIAHEIQNPLNFVNNFSDVSTELLEEMLEEMNLGNIDEVKEILNDVMQNLEKITHHGKRADGIVKGMLQHSRTSQGEKEPTDLNGLCDEYLRLSYHGLRAKDKSFNATLETDFDDTLGKINIIPQDMGRVILNLLTNAFYAVNEKKQQHPDGYQPTVSISTKKVNGTIEIKVSDNGNGIPKNAVEKIFQPFYTTKPTGQGTGLGLSLSYDIVQAHGGELKVETKKGKGSEFIIQLPVVRITD